MDDLISRQAAIDFIKHEQCKKKNAMEMSLISARTAEQKMETEE